MKPDNKDREKRLRKVLDGMPDVHQRKRLREALQSRGLLPGGGNDDAPGKDKGKP